MILYIKHSFLCDLKATKNFQHLMRESEITPCHNKKCGDVCGTTDDYRPRFCQQGGYCNLGYQPICQGIIFEKHE